MIGVCGKRSAGQDHRIVSEPIVSGSFLGLGLDHSNLRKTIRRSTSCDGGLCEATIPVAKRHHVA